MGNGGPDYRDVQGMQIALDVSHYLAEYDSFEVMEVFGAAPAVMQEEAPTLTYLITRASKDILGGATTEAELHQVRAGAALLRALHVTAYLKLDR